MSNSCGWCNCALCTLLALSKLVLSKFIYVSKFISRHGGVEISRGTAWGSPSRREILKRAEHETIPNVTPSRVITAAVPSYTRYLNPHGSLVNRRRDLVKATQPIPVSKLPCRVSHDPLTNGAVRRPYLSATPPPLPSFIRSNYIITLRLPPFPPIAYDGLLTLFARPSTTGNHLTASISINDVPD